MLERVTGALALLHAQQLDAHALACSCPAGSDGGTCADNPPALQAYRRLGYAEHVRFEERLAHRIGSPWADLTAPLRRLFVRREMNRR